MQQRTDDQIRADIVEHLRSAGLTLTVTVERGVLRLEGIVTSEEERQAALDLAGWVPGIQQLVDDMELREMDVDSPGALFLPLSSSEEPDGITDDPMLAASEGLAYFPPTDPPVRLRDDSDELEVASGFMSTALDDDELDSEEDAERGERAGDAELVDRVLENLKEDARTTHLNLYITAFNGTVVLTGTVHDNLDSDMAVEVAADTPSVDEVIDRTVLGAPAGLPAEERPLHRQAQMAHVITPNASWRATVISNRFKLDQMRQAIKERVGHLERDIRAYGEDQEQEGAGSSHEADLATDLTSAAELTAELNAARNELARIEEAFERMETGVYGICVDTGQLIEAARLRANPLAIRTIEAQRRFEGQHMR
jgi:RNA polymerase-binding transcription factor DksA/osmotically-inducible protein OsmY